MKTTKLQFLGVLILTQLAGCLGSNGTTATTSNSARISYDGATDPATLTQANSASLLAGAYQGGQAASALGSSAGLINQNAGHRRPGTLLLSQTLDKAVQKAIEHGPLIPGNAAAITDVTNQLTGNCGGQMSYSGTVNDETREFYLDLSFDNYCDDSTTVNGNATASGQTDTTGYHQDMYNDKSLAPNPYSIAFETLTISASGSSFSANGYALITKEDELDLDESPDVGEAVNPDNTPDGDADDPADEQTDIGGITTIKLNCVLRDDATKATYKAENFTISLTNGAGFVDAVLSGRYFDPVRGYIDVTTPTPLRINATDYWPTSGLLNATGNNDSASLTALSNTTYQLDVDSNADGTADITATGTWSDL